MSTEVRLIRKGPDDYTIDLGAKGLPELRIDISGVPDQDKPKEHIGARLLMAAALACYTNTMFNDLTKAGGQVTQIEARAVIEKAQDSARRTKYDNMSIEVTAQVDQLDDSAFEAVRSTMMRGSLVTYSLDEGIEMDYEVDRT